MRSFFDHPQSLLPTLNFTMQLRVEVSGDLQSI